MKILEINEERGKTVVSLLNGTQVVLTDDQAKSINDVIVNALKNSLKVMEEKKETPKAKKETPTAKKKRSEERKK